MPTRHDSRCSATALRTAPRTVVAAGALSAVLLGAAGCTAVTVPPGPAAADPACADVIVGAPEELLGLPRQETTSQGTLAWGTGDGAVVLRCGVAPPPPTTEHCATLEDTSGTQIDWIVREDESGYVRFTTYGREPAIDLTVPRASAPDQPSAAALDLGQLVGAIPATAHCVGAGDL